MCTTHSGYHGRLKVCGQECVWRGVTVGSKNTDQSPVFTVPFVTCIKRGLKANFLGGETEKRSIATSYQ